METVNALLLAADGAVAALLLPIAVWILISAIDDLGIFLVWAARRPVVKAPPPNQPERPIAIFVPCWREAAVIGKMLDHNSSAIRYRNYHWFIGCYPNDTETQRAVEAVTARHPNVHVALCMHPGPTSKADCLNWVYQRMQQFEQETAIRFELVVQHDAEDLVHPASLEWMNFYSRFFGMIQTPVFALPTPVRMMTHGIYCDDFAYSHTVDLPVRYLLGGFIPSAGVGTAYRRDALEALAESSGNQIFVPGCLTEDYENGFRLHRLGIKQLFIPTHAYPDGRPLATREYFPQQFYAAWRQRTRWVTGIVFQGWERHGWGRGWDKYWFWRDRKGIVGNLLSVAANLMFFYGCVSGALHAALDVPWTAHRDSPMLAMAAVIGIAQSATRIYCSSRLYGLRFALFAPLRTVPANLLNSASTVAAAWRYVAAKVKRQPLAWVKTDHSYPSLAALAQHKRPLAEVLLAGGYLNAQELAMAESTRPAGRRLDEHLVTTGLLSAAQMCEVLSMHHNLPAASFDPAMIRLAVARSLPAHLIEEYKVVPVGITRGVMRLASPEVPSDRLQRELKQLTQLETEFVLIPPDNFRMLCERLLWEQAASREEKAMAAGAGSGAGG